MIVREEQRESDRKLAPKVVPPVKCATSADEGNVEKETEEQNNEEDRLGCFEIVPLNMLGLILKGF